MKQGFPPIAEKTAIILILGTMPGEESLKKKEYYAHPRNAFWEIMASLFDFNPSLNYEEKNEILKDNRIALWDVMKACEREGSLDSKIKKDTIIENDFVSFFNKYPNISYVFFNGSRAKQEYTKRVLPKLAESKHEIKYAQLPSTSPAMAHLSLDEKILEWSKLIRKQ
ncbi:DNA-deoxyinosine glycosylase [Deltaproteobacteria bacterium TL4]